MTILNTKELSARGRVDENGFRRWVVKHQVRTDARSDGPLSVLTDILSPAYASSYSFGGHEKDLGAFRREAECELISEDDSHKLWRLEVVYSSSPVTRPDVTLHQGGSGTDDPTSRVIISGSFVPYQAAVTRDRHGAPVLNSAKELFEGLTKDANRPSLTIETTYTKSWFVSNFDLITRAISKSALNDQSWFYHSEATWKLMGAPWKEVYFGTETYYTVVWSFELNVDTWHLKPADMGTGHWLGGLTGTFERFADDAGLGYAGDGRGALNGDGTKRARDSEPVVRYFDGAAADSAGAPFEVYDPLDFADKFQLPATFKG